MKHDEGRRLDFFLSYAPKDEPWAAWIAWTLEELGFRVKLQAWDSQVGSNRIHFTDTGIREASRTIALLSEEYLAGIDAAAEWQAVWAQDPGGDVHKLLPVRVSDCSPSGLLAGIVTIDLFELDEDAARSQLEEMAQGVMAGRRKPTVAPNFPGSKLSDRQPPFPGVAEAGQSGGAPNEEVETGATVTHISDFRNSNRKSIYIPSSGRLRDLIVELSESAERADMEYRATSSAYAWTRLELDRCLSRIQSHIDGSISWVSIGKISDDPDTFNLRDALRLHASTAEEFGRALSALDVARSAMSREELLAKYEAAWRSLEDLLCRIHDELELALQTAELPD